MGNLMIDIEALLRQGKTVKEVCKALKIDKLFVESVYARIQREDWAELG